MTKRCERALTDESLQGEIELLGDVIVAVNLLARPLTEAELDEALGLPHPQPHVDESAPQNGRPGHCGDVAREVRALLTPRTTGLRRSPSASLRRGS